MRRVVPPSIRIPRSIKNNKDRIIITPIPGPGLSEGCFSKRVPYKNSEGKFLWVSRNQLDEMRKKNSNN